MERTCTVYVYMVHACIYIHARLATPTNGSPMPARRTHAPACCVRARACARVRSGAHASAPTHASAFPSAVDRGWPRRAGVLLRVGVQRQHRRVEHRGCYRLVRGMRRPFRPGRRATAGGTRSAGRRCGAGRCARRRRRCARACVCAQMQTCGNAHARMPTCVARAARTKDGIYVCMCSYVYIYIYMYLYLYAGIIHIDVGICVLV
jgi:hypothetical protein